MNRENIIEDHLYPFIVLMKVGPFCGYNLDEIISIKRNEEAKVGKFYFGYGGVFCHPRKVLRFVEFAKKRGVEKIKLLFLTTASDFNSETPKSNLVSENGFDWTVLHPDVLLVGSKYAFVAKNIVPQDYNLDISQYRSMLGKRRGDFLNDYIRYRVDKSCAIYEPRNVNPVFVNVKYESELTTPYCVLVK